MKLDWLIIGGGIHGVHIAARLLGEAGVPRERVRIVDPGERLLERWRTCTATTGMTHLRSPSVHNLDLDPWSLLRHAGKPKRTKGKRAGKRRKDKLSLFAPPYDRPQLRFFNDHCDQVIEAFGLDSLHVRARASSCTVDCDGVIVQLSTGQEITAQRLVLAIGAGEKPERPAWAPAGLEQVQHVFEHGFDGWPEEGTTVAVVGGGISACQVALRLADEGHQVHLISRHSLREHQFDSDPGWLGPKYMRNFKRESDLDRRRVLISNARHRGSVPPDVRRGLRIAIDEGQLSWHESDIKAVEHGSGPLVMELTTGGRIEVDRVLLATGFSSTRPGGSLIDELVEQASLPCAGCGYPIVDSSLRWHPRIHVSGPLAELELGPVARNIAGARRAADRLVGAARTAQVTDQERPA